MENGNIRKVQFWQTIVSVPVFLFWAAICVGAFFGGNFKDFSLRQTDFWWWLSALILALVSRRYYKRATKIGIIVTVAAFAAIGMCVTDNFVGILLVECIIDAGVVTAMFLLSFLPALEFFEYKPFPKLMVLYPVFSFLSLCFVVIISFFLSSMVTILLAAITL